MSVKLLDQTRKIEKLLHDNHSYVVIFNDICACLGGILQANVMVVSGKGKVLGIFEQKSFPSLKEMLTDNVGEKIDPDLNERFLNVLSTKENGNLVTLGFEKAADQDYSAVILPIDYAGKRLGTTFLYRLKREFSVDDIILCEYANTVVELEMMRAVYEEKTEEKRKNAAVGAAVSSLSRAEQEAIRYVLGALNHQKEGTIIASRIASENSITRSVIVNAIQKLESAGILEAHSRGMRGTYLKIHNLEILNNFEEQE